MQSLFLLIRGIEVVWCGPHDVPLLAGVVVSLPLRFWLIEDFCLELGHRVIFAEGVKAVLNLHPRQLSEKPLRLGDGQLANMLRLDLGPPVLVDYVGTALRSDHRIVDLGQFHNDLGKLS